jgi:mono/diheme cytochrome c family protein
MGRLTGSARRGVGPMIVMAAAMAVANSNGARADTWKGEMLAAQLCAGCHAVHPGQNSSNPKATPFAAVATNPSYNIFTLRSFLRTPHWTSTNLSLKPDDNEAIASYIMSLQPRR